MSTQQPTPCAYSGCPGDARWHVDARDGGRTATVRVCAYHFAILHCQGKLATYAQTGTPREERRHG